MAKAPQPPRRDIRPIPSKKGLTPTKEEFEAWAQLPVTQWVALSHQIMAERNKQSWVTQSWDQGRCNEHVLIELRTRADAYMAFIEATYEKHLENLTE